MTKAKRASPAAMGGAVALGLPDAALALAPNSDLIPRKLLFGNPSRAAEQQP